MHPTYTVTPISTESLIEVPGDWSANDFRKILELTEYGDLGAMTDKEVEEMALMSIADLEKHEAAELLLTYVFPDGGMNEGQIQNASYEMDTEKLWEEYPEPERHRALFRAGCLLYRAYNGGFPKPDGRRITIGVKPEKAAGAEHLEAPEAAFVLRLLAPGLDGHALLHRLFEDELSGTAFPNAPNIAWNITKKPGENGAIELTILSSDYWLEAFGPSGDYTVKAYPDEVPEED